MGANGHFSNASCKINYCIYPVARDLFILYIVCYTILAGLQWILRQAKTRIYLHYEILWVHVGVLIYSR
jgi:hypothetical protein